MEDRASSTQERFPFSPWFLPLQDEAISLRVEAIRYKNFQLRHTAEVLQTIASWPQPQPRCFQGFEFCRGPVRNPRGRAPQFVCLLCRVVRSYGGLHTGPCRAWQHGQLDWRRMGACQRCRQKIGQEWQTHFMPKPIYWEMRERGVDVTSSRVSPMHAQPEQGTSQNPIVLPSPTPSSPPTRSSSPQSIQESFIVLPPQEAAPIRERRERAETPPDWEEPICCYAHKRGFDPDTHCSPGVQVVGPLPPVEMSQGARPKGKAPQKKYGKPRPGPASKTRKPVKEPSQMEVTQAILKPLQEDLEAIEKASLASMDVLFRSIREKGNLTHQRKMHLQDKLEEYELAMTMALNRCIKVYPPLLK